MPITQHFPTAYPPRIFSTKLDKLMAEHELTDAWLCQFLDVVPVTARRIREGKDLPLSDAIKLARYFNTTVEGIWRFAA